MSKATSQHPQQQPQRRFLVAAHANNPCIGPQTGKAPIASRDPWGAAGGPTASFGQNWPLAASGERGTTCKRFLSTVGCSGLDSQGLATILDPFQAIFAHLGPDRQMSAVETGKMSSVETGQMSAVETGQMSAAETGQMSAVETRQMYSIKTGQRPVAIVDICLVSTADICPVAACLLYTSPSPRD